MNVFAVLLFLGSVALLVIYAVGAALKAYDKRHPEESR